MRKGVRRFQNEDGTYTEAGKKRYFDYSTNPAGHRTSMNAQARTRMEAASAKNVRINQAAIGERNRANWAARSVAERERRSQVANSARRPHDPVQQRASMNAQARTRMESANAANRRSNQAMIEERNRSKWARSKNNQQSTNASMNAQALTRMNAATNVREQHRVAASIGNMNQNKKAKALARRKAQEASMASQARLNRTKIHPSTTNAAIKAVNDTKNRIKEESMKSIHDWNKYSDKRNKKSIINSTREIADKRAQAAKSEKQKNFGKNIDKTIQNSANSKRQKLISEFWKQYASNGKAINQTKKTVYNPETGKYEERIMPKAGSESEKAYEKALEKYIKDNMDEREYWLARGLDVSKAKGAAEVRKRTKKKAKHGGSGGSFK
jgi:hypothetical protein